MFERGYLKYALLDLLQERPKHGYEMMKDLEDRMGGFYAPSAGAIYPTLQLMEDRGWVNSETQEGKKVYTITDAGRAALAEAAERRGPRPGPGGPEGFEGPRHGPHGHHEHGHHQHGPFEGGPFGPKGPRGPWGWGEPGGGPGFEQWSRPETRDLARQARDLGRLFLLAGRDALQDPARMQRLREIMTRAQGELEAFLREGASGPATGSQGSQPGSAPGGETGSVEQF